MHLDSHYKNARLTGPRGFSIKQTFKISTYCDAAYYDRPTLTNHLTVLLLVLRQHLRHRHQLLQRGVCLCQCLQIRQVRHANMMQRRQFSACNNSIKKTKPTIKFHFNRSNPLSHSTHPNRTFVPPSPVHAPAVDSDPSPPTTGPETQSSAPYS